MDSWSIDLGQSSFCFSWFFFVCFKYGWFVINFGTSLKLLGYNDNYAHGYFCLSMKHETLKFSIMVILVLFCLSNYLFTFVFPIQIKWPLPPTPPTVPMWPISSPSFLVFCIIHHVFPKLYNYHSLILGLLYNQPYRNTQSRSIYNLSW